MALDLTPSMPFNSCSTIGTNCQGITIKGYRRLPATGNVQALQYYLYLFGDQSPFTYALSATFTILFCTKLKWQVDYECL